MMWDKGKWWFAAIFAITIILSTLFWKSTLHVFSPGPIYETIP